MAALPPLKSTLLLPPPPSLTGGRRALPLAIFILILLSLPLGNRVFAGVIVPLTYIVMALYVFFNRFKAAVYGSWTIPYSMLIGAMPHAVTVAIAGVGGQVLIYPSPPTRTVFLAISAIVEELFFRASLSEELGPRSRILLVPVIYGVYHLPLRSILLTYRATGLLPIYIFTGIVLQILYERAGIVAAVSTHIVYNLVASNYLLLLNSFSLAVMTAALILTLLLVLETLLPRWRRALFSIKAL